MQVNEKLLTKEELLFAEQGLYKAIAKDVDTKDPNNLRGQCDEGFIDLFNATGAKSFEARIDGEKVGTVSVVKSGGRHMHRLTISDSVKALAWAIQNDCVQIDFKSVEEHFQSTGEVGDGFELEFYEEPETTRTTLRIDPEKVKKHLRLAMAQVFGELPEGEL